MRFLNLVFFSFSYQSYEALCLFWEFINHLNFRIWLLSLFHLCWRRILFTPCVPFWILMKLRIVLLN
jgi:hypothetical protein